MMLLRVVASRIGWLLVILSASALFCFAGETGTLYRKKCAPCHGQNGEGNKGAKAPSLVSAKVRNMSDDELRKLISQRANGEMEKDPSHTQMKERLTATQAEEIIGYIREMQNKSAPK
jgi:cytochrome c553